MPGLNVKLDCALMQEFPERLRIYKKNCENIRERNAVNMKKGFKVRVLPQSSWVLCTRHWQMFPSGSVSTASILFRSVHVALWTANHGRPVVSARRDERCALTSVG